jgi:hypothetical protein
MYEQQNAISDFIDHNGKDPDHYIGKRVAWQEVEGGKFYIGEIIGWTVVEILVGADVVATVRLIAKSPDTGQLFNCFYPRVIEKSKYEL